MLSLNQLTYTINDRILFNNISITFLPSSIVYLNGANGCGKTSLLRMIAGIQRPTSGHISYKYNSFLEESNKPYCTYIGHNLGLKLQLTVFENLKFWSEIYNSLEVLEASIHYFQLQNILDTKCYELSSGNQKKVALSRLLSCQSDLWLLDEVESNLDQKNRDLLNNLIIAKANNNGIILISSHEKALVKSAQFMNIEDYKT
jgi:heme exporter protein A